VDRPRCSKVSPIHLFCLLSSSRVDCCCCRRQHVLDWKPCCLPAGFLKEGCELINEALNLFNNVYGAMHVEICACLRLLARLNYIMGDHAEVRAERLVSMYFFLTMHVCMYVCMYASVSCRMFVDLLPFLTHRHLATSRRQF